MSACEKRTKAARTMAKREKQKLRNNIRSLKKQLAKTVVAPIVSNNVGHSSNHNQHPITDTQRRTGHADEAGGNCKRRNQRNETGASHSTAWTLDK